MAIGPDVPLEETISRVIIWGYREAIEDQSVCRTALTTVRRVL